MPTLLFVHGTGVRKAAYEIARDTIWEQLSEKLPKDKLGKIRLEKCLWGDSYGTRLNAQGKSIPNYDRTGQAKTAEERDRRDRITLWEMLEYDPLYELHGLALRNSINKVNTIKFDAKVKNLPSDALNSLLKRAGIDQTFTAARDHVVNALDYKQTLLGAVHESDCYGPVARALLAEAVSRSGDDPPPAVRFNPRLRDDVVEAISGELGRPTRSVAGWAVNKLFNLAQRLHVVDLIYERGKLTDGAAPAAGDVVMYQARGADIREFIRGKIERAHRLNPPVVVLAHSLGGIACVDLYAEKEPKVPPPPIHALVTVGSQAPFLYEINALQSLRYGEELPATFPKWLNIYDPRDLLSYVAEEVFKFEGKPKPDIRDEEVDNGLPFPDAHSGYWANPKTWDLLFSVLP